MPKKINQIKNKNETKPAEPVKAPETNFKQKFQNKIDMMKNHLENQPKVSILIPLEKGEKKGAAQPFCINGYRFTVPKGTMTQVPQQVAEMIAERFNVELEVRGRSLEQMSSDTKRALE